MKIFKIIFISFLILFVCFFASISVYLNVYGKDKFQDVLRNAFNRDVSISSLTYRFPFGFSASQVSIDGLLTVDKLSGQISVASSRSKCLQISSLLLDGPSVVWEKKKSDPQESLVQEEVLGEQKGKIVDDINEEERFSLDIKVDNFYIRNGKVTIVGVFPSDEMTIALDSLWGEAKNVLVPFTRDQDISFVVNAELAGDDHIWNSGQVKGSGWVNVARKNMVADFIVERAKPDVGINVHLVSKENNLKVNGDIQWGDFPLGETLIAAEKELTVEESVLDVLSKWDVRVGAKFDFETKMDDFRLDDKNIQFSGQIETK